MNTDYIEARGFNYYLQQLDAFLRLNLGRNYVQTREERESLVKGRSVQFSYKGKVDVDLLVSPNWKDQFQLYRFLGSCAKPSK